MDQVKQQQELAAILKRCRTSRRLRQELAYKSHLWFFQIFLPHYMTYPLSWFHREMFAISEKKDLKLAVIMAFRESGKSTILNSSFTIWAILGKLQKKFIIIISQSHNQARAHFENIKYELENNQLLKNDLGPFQSYSDDTGSNYIEIKKYHAKIMFIGSWQSIRGLRHGPHRPDLIICDDIEDSHASSNSKRRKNLYDWFKTEVLPAGSAKTTIIVLGNLLNQYSLLMQLKKNIDKGKTDEIFCAYPLLDDDGRIVWPEKFSSMDDIMKLKKTINDDKIWELEYLLQINDGEPEELAVLSEEEYDFYLEQKKSFPLNAYGYRIRAPIIDWMKLIIDI